MLVPLYTLFHISVPVTEVVFDPISVTVDGRSGTQGHVVAAQPLTKRQGTVVGSGSRSRWTPADSRISGLNAIGENWVKVHLLHGPDLHGPNDPQNFAPGPSTTNTEIYNDIELKAIEAVEDNQVLWYATEATYAQPDPDDSMFPSTIRVEWGAFDHTAGRRTRTNASKSYPIRPPGEGRSVASLSYDGRVMLQRVGGLRPAYATAIAEARRRSGLAPFDSFAAVGFALTYSQGRADVENIIKDIQARAVAGKLRL
jgi:hypothetical protein